MLGRLQTVVILSAVVWLAACGGGGGGGGAAPAAAALADTSGRVVDGYVFGATVTLDKDDDRTFSGPSVVAGADGSYSFSGQGLHMVRVTGGVDQSTLAPFLGELRAAPGATVVSPLTTLVVASVESSLPAAVRGQVSRLDSARVSAAETSLKTNLGIAAGVALSTTDPVAAVQANPSDASLGKLLQQNVAAQVLMQRTALAVAAATGIAVPTDAQVSALHKEAAKALAAASAAGTIDLAATTSTVADNLLRNTVTLAKSSAGVAAALPAASTTRLAGLLPDSVAAAAGQAITDQVRAVAAAPAATLAASAGGDPAKAAGHPALVAFSNSSLQVALSQMSPLLTQAVQAVNTASDLRTLGNAVTASLNAGGASGLNAAASAINQQLTLTLSLIPGSAVTNVTPATVTAAVTAANSATSQSLSQSQQWVTTGTPPASQTPGSGGAVAVNLDALNGTFASPATFDAASGGGSFNFTDSVATASFTRISNFGANDSIAITGGGANHLIVANDGADVVFTVNANGVVSQITLVGATSPSAIIGSLAAFNALGIGTVTYQ